MICSLEGERRQDGLTNGQDMTIVEMLEKSAGRYPEKTAIIYRDQRVSYEEFYAESIRLGCFLSRIGLIKGERVGLLLKKTPEAVISFLGIASSGGIVFPIDYNLTLGDIQYTLELTKPTVLVVAADFQPMLSKLDLPCSDDRIIIIGKKAKERYHSWEEILLQKAVGLPRVKIEEDDTVYLNFTSGTTGLPKAALSTHANIYWNTLASVESLGLVCDDVHLCLFPVFGHPHELFARPILLGGTMVLIDNISPKTIARAISDHRVTCMMAVASIYGTLARFHRSNPFDFSPLRVPESGGMHLTRAVARRFEAEFKTQIIPVWGSTETMGVALANCMDDVNKAGSIGRPCPYYQIRIVGEGGEESGPNEIGEMIVRGPAVSSGYFGNLEETEKHMRDGWFFTGDLVKKDPDGYYYFAGRKTGMMKVAGLKVFPAEIEDILSSHPKIAEVAVVKVKDHLHGEVPKAVIVLKEGATSDKAEIKRYSEKRMPKCKVPRVIEFCTELPKTPGGKVLYRALPV